MSRVVKGLLFLALSWMIFGFATSELWAQSTSNGSIVGRVTDDSGAAVPNVLITVTSPQLQVPEVTTTSDANGDYRVLDLPAPGVYKVTFSLNGFETFDREGLNLTVGFAAHAIGEDEEVERIEDAEGILVVGAHASHIRQAVANDLHTRSFQALCEHA